MDDRHEIEVTGQSWSSRRAVICSCGFKVTDLSSAQSAADVAAYHLAEPTNTIGSDPW